MNVALNKSQYRAVNDLHGLPCHAHTLVMCSRGTATGGALDGSEQAFEELVAFIGEEIAEDTLSAASLKALSALCIKIDPGCADWLGM